MPFQSTGLDISVSSGTACQRELLQREIYLAINHIQVIFAIAIVPAYEFGFHLHTTPKNTWRYNNVVKTPKRRHFDVITSL